MKKGRRWAKARKIKLIECRIILVEVTSGLNDRIEWLEQVLNAKLARIDELEKEANV